MDSETIIFQVGNSLAVRLVGDCKIPRGTRVRERREGDCIIIEPIRAGWSPAFLATAGSWAEPIPRPSDGDDKPRDPFA